MSRVLLILFVAFTAFVFGHSLPSPKENIPGPTSAEVKAYLASLNQ